MPKPHVIVLFGATGDLAKRKLLPGILHLSQTQLMPEFRVVGTSLEDLDDDAFREFAREAVEFSRHPVSDSDWNEFAQRLAYVPHDAGPAGLKDAVDRAGAELGPDHGLLHYLSVPPASAADVIEMLGDAGLAERARVIMEKPFGTDLQSARKLNAIVHSVFEEEQVFRIDHFLGKEAALNILALRFANGLFEPIWNRNHIDHVQIDVPETLDVGTRARFYEGTGRLPGHGRHPPHADPRLRRDGAADRARAAGDHRREEQGLSLVAADRSPARGPRPVRRLPRPPGRRPELRHRDTRRAARPCRQLALVGRAVLPAHRQVHGRGGADHLDRISRAAAEHVHEVVGGR